LDGSVPVVILDPVEGVKIDLHPLSKLRKISIPILIVFGDAGKIKGEVFLFEGLSPLIQGLTDLFFFGGLAGAKEEKEEQNKESIPSHSFFSVSSLG
jgi:hypothetical protein